MKITTKTGDKGETSLFGGCRVRKDSPLIMLLGDIDELQAFVGFCKACKGVEEDVKEALEQVCDDLYRMMSVVGFELKVPTSIENISEKDVHFLDGLIDKYIKQISDLNKFVRPGDNEISARFHLARTVCRRVERAMVEVEKEGMEILLQYLNRLSDVLFIFARKYEG